MTDKAEIEHRRERRRVLKFLQLQAKTGFGLDRDRASCSTEWLERERRHTDYGLDLQEWKDFHEGEEEGVEQ
jgi:hypothetical protein